MASAPVTVRAATPADLQDILALYRILDEEMVALQPDFFCVAPREEEPLLGLLARPDAVFFLAEQNGAVIGFALVCYAGWTPSFSSVLPHRYAELCDIVVAPEARCQGAGSQLVAAAKRWARDHRLEYLELTVLAQNTRANSLYEAHDFVDATRVMRCML